jgi:hypothetical protein
MAARDKPSGQGGNIARNPWVTEPQAIIARTAISRSDVAACSSAMTDGIAATSHLYRRPFGLTGMHVGLAGRPRAKYDSDTGRPIGRLVLERFYMTRHSQLPNRGGVDLCTVRRSHSYILVDICY